MLETAKVVWARLTLVWAARIAIGLIGLVTVFLGLVVAWRVGAGTTLLVVGSLLLLVALVGPRVQKLTAKHGDTELSLDLIDRVDEALDVVKDAEGEEELRARLEELERSLEATRTEIAAAALDAEEDRFREIILAKRHAELSAAKADEVPRVPPPAPRATHAIGPNHAKLKVRVPGASMLLSVFCRVTSPSGDDFFAQAKRATAGLPWVQAVFEVTYPDDFPGAEWRIGVHRVEWSSRSVFVAALVPPTTVALDEFAVSS